MACTSNGISWAVRSLRTIWSSCVFCATAPVFLHQLEPGNTFYNLPLAVPFNVAVNAAVLERSINEIVNRHETLRTVFDTVDGEPMQIVRPALALRLAQSSTCGRCRRTIKTRNDAVDRRNGAAAVRSAQGCCCALRCFSAACRIMSSYRWCTTSFPTAGRFGVFWRELTALYNAFYLNLPSPLEELPIQYADLPSGKINAARRASGRTRRLLEKQLDGLPTLQLPADRPRPPVLSYRGAFQELALPRALTGALKALSQREGVTLFMTLFAGFAVLLQRYSGQDDIVVGLPAASRDRKELEGLIGFFINSLVLRVNLSGDPSFRTLLSRVREIALDAYAHQELPFEKLVEELQPERDLSRNPLFQVSFQLFSAPSERTQEPQAADTPAIAVNRGSAIFDLAVNLWEATDEIGGHLEYSTDLFEASTVARLAGHFKTLLKSACANPDAKLSELQLLSDVERHQMLFEWTTPRPRSRHSASPIVRAASARKPRALAISPAIGTWLWRAEPAGKPARPSPARLA